MKIFMLILLGLFALSAGAQNPGILDADFGTAGRVVTSFPPGSFRLGGGNCTVLRPDNRILSAMVNLHVPLSINILGYQPDGGVDSTWGTNGAMVAEFPNLLNVSVNDMSVQPDGKVLLVGGRDTAFNNTFAMAGFLARYMPDGRVDTSFGNQGYIVQFNPDDTTSPHVTYVQVAVAGSRIIVAGLDSVDHLRLQAFHIADGSADLSWGTNGLKQYNFRDITATSTSPWSLKVLDDGSFLLHHNDLILKFQDTGLLDSSFANQGYFTPRFAVVKGHANVLNLVNLVSLGITPDNKILVSGKAQSLSLHDGMGVVERYTADGFLDSSFADKGILLVDFRNGEYAVNYLRSIAVHDDGSFEVAGVVKDSTTGEFLFAMRRYDSDGKTDSLFGNNGLVVTSAFMPNDSVNIASDVLIQQPHDKIILAGFVPRYNATVNGETPASIVMARYFSKATMVSGVPFAQAMDFSVYPNPLHDYINIAGPESTMVTVFAADGKRVVANQALFDGFIRLDCSQWSQGMYYIHLTNAAGGVGVSKVVK